MHERDVLGWPDACSAQPLVVCADNRPSSAHFREPLTLQKARTNGDVPVTTRRVQPLLSVFRGREARGNGDVLVTTRRPQRPTAGGLRRYPTASQRRPQRPAASGPRRFSGGTRWARARGPITIRNSKRTPASPPCTRARKTPVHDEWTRTPTQPGPADPGPDLDPNQRNPPAKGGNPSAQANALLAQRTRSWPTPAHGPPTLRSQHLLSAPSLPPGERGARPASRHTQTPSGHSARGPAQQFNTASWRSGPPIH